MTKPKAFTFSQEQLKALFDYCPSGRLIRKVSTSPLTLAGSVAGTTRPEGYRRVYINDTYWFEHRLIYFWHTGDCPEVLDHINGCRDDNRIENLRAVSQAVNSQNRHKRLDSNTSGHTGVSWDKRRQRWYAYLKVGYQMKYLGRFKELEDAVNARAAAVAALHPGFIPTSQHG